MEVTDALIDKLAHLSRLTFNGDEKKAIRQDLEKMIEFIGKLNELDTTGVKPTLHMSEEVNILRNDDIQGSISTQEALKNAAVHNDQYFLVPRVMKHETP